ncbi:hypothetical protein PAXRUDRAFT_15460 [Paxillus rubicundulus Ve08.2h10]|uniref:Uncharacterized protein n=1 Tax=Paxillus rubicundulus Ve08.2h10 TaxID=930991 RepID=A0A0D0DAQ6_9AGAM|nr:hypothetical protein PAXRUDRAFT_15460 [Paxillus rubicundulus Ve08.2h10]
MSDNPPPYSDIQPAFPSQSSPPQYTLPETFIIGSQRVSLLVRPQHLKGHLSLLHAFHTLRHTIEAGDMSRLPHDVRTMDPDKRWGWFVNIAVERFSRWCISLNEHQLTNIEQTLPPIDVVMVWHAYLLNPIWYAEDTARISALKSLGPYTQYLASHIGSPDLLVTNSPQQERIQSWEKYTQTPYDPLAAAAVLSYKDVQCPHCESWTVVPFLSTDGAGYAQRNFAASCLSCGKTIKKDLLGLHKFAKDVVKNIANEPKAFFAGTLHTPYEKNDTARAWLIMTRVVTAAKLPSSPSATLRVLSVNEAMQMLKYDPALLGARLNSHVQQKMASRILGAYSDDRPFSIDLVGAVLRQASFVHKMAELGWTQPNFFSDEEDMMVLQHCVARYHAFLALMADSSGSFFVPTLDIDLAWHTHQLMANQYHSDCKSLVGRYVDHDDKVEEDHLATAFDITCRAWNDRYGLPYTYCGCPLPGTTLGQKLRRALSSHTPVAHSALRPPSEAAVGTHPSDHNAVFAMHNAKASLRAREQRQQKTERRRLREEREMQAVNRDGRRSLGPVHGQAFLYPVPLYYAPIGGCVLYVGVFFMGWFVRFVGLMWLLVF